MSEPVPEAGGAPTNFLMQKFLGIPAIVWLLGAAILAYLYFRSQSGSSSSTTNSNTTAATPQKVNLAGPKITINEQPTPAPAPDTVSNTSMS